MALVVIAAKHVTPGLKVKLEECMSFFQRTGNDVVVEEKKLKPWPHYVCELQGDPQEVGVNPSLRSLLAETLAKYVVQVQAPAFLSDLIASQYYYFSREERQMIMTLAENNYMADPAKSEGGPVYAQVLQCLLEYLEQHNYVNLHGLIVFRMHGWLQYLRKIVDKSVDDFLMEKEYQEFIRLLKYFVALQEPKIKQVHVVLADDCTFRVLDHDYQPVKQQEANLDGFEGSGDEEDQLVSMLITVAPHRIVLHKNVYTQYPKAVDTLKHVFENRVVLCRSCKLCHDTGKKTLVRDQ